MRLTQGFTKFLFLLGGLLWVGTAFLPTTRADQTNIFSASVKLDGSISTPQGILKVRPSGSVLLGTNSTSSVLAVAVSGMTCQTNGLQPHISIVAYDPNLGQIVATLVEFQTVSQLFDSVNEIVVRALGVGRNGVVSADMEALIDLRYEPCVSTNLYPQPVSISIQPLGWIRPTGAIPYTAPILPDVGVVDIGSLESTDTTIVDIAGIGATPSAVAKLDISPKPVNFGTVQVGTNSTMTLALRNNGGISCVITSVVKSGSSAFTITPPANPFVIAAGGVVNVPVQFTPVTNGLDSAVIRVISSDTNNPVQYIAAYGTGSTTSPEQIIVSPLTLNFGSVEIGTNKTLQVNVINTGGQTGIVDLVTLLTQSPDFEYSPTNVPFAIAPGSTQVVSVVYMPSLVGAQSGTLQIDTDDSRHRLTLINLLASGTTAKCQLDVAPSALNFGAVITGANRQLLVGITNNSLTSCTLSGVAVTGSAAFTFSPTNMPQTVLPGTVTNLTVDFAPSASGQANGTLTITYSSPVTSSAISLTGLGVEASTNCSIVVTTNLFDYGYMAVGQTNILKTQVSNTGVSNCTVQALWLNGGTDFTTNGLVPVTPFVLPAGAMVELGVRYVPSGVGQDVGVLQVITDDQAQPEFPITLTGIGIQPTVTVSTNAVGFGGVLVGSSGTITVWVSNTNVVDAIITGIGIVGSFDFQLDPIVPATRFVLRAGETIAIPVTYEPSTRGNAGGTLRVFSNDPNSPATVALTGAGLECELAVSPTSIDFGIVTFGRSNTVTVTISNIGNTNCVLDALSLLGGAAFDLALPPLPSTITAGDKLELSVTYTPKNAQSIMIVGGSIRSSGKPIQVP